jgi:hypothetical protein
MAAGSSALDPGQHTLILKWNGAAWSLMASPNP